MGLRSKAVPLRKSCSIIDRLALLPLVIVAFVVFAYWAMVVDRQPPRDTKSVIVIPDRIARGEYFTVSFDVTPLRPGVWTAVTTHELVGVDVGYVRVLDKVTTVYDPATSRPVMSRQRQIPVNIPIGITRYRVTGCYWSHGFSLTRLWPICKVWPEGTFEIVEP